MTIRRTLCRAAAVLALTSAVGCGGSGPRTHAVAGRVEFAGGDVGQLAGHNVEVALAADPRVRAYGVIEPDGRFKSETYENGTILRGAKEGDYTARVVLVDEGAGQQKKPKVAARFLKFDTSGLRVTVPAVEDVRLVVSAK